MQRLSSCSSLVAPILLIGRCITIDASLENHTPKPCKYPHPNQALALCYNNAMPSDPTAKVAVESQPGSVYRYTR
ncbi:hypothetical protein PCANC_21922 [Puccinia coronata f. sp. avenae]|uniref:Secreted protein n=1 Tax=Puccinia coronata f. sp. avenae TaxID=200324 RepID=A0A2N5TU30_9BASI|nr:hypothetical protein PCANC_21922 [Puccinia coronata f. sp. avenae]PLW28977.1 hypothetical protein PCASD_19463 [Puccinia coronata f. sp. avenae]